MDRLPSLSGPRIFGGVVFFVLCFCVLCGTGGGVSAALASEQVTFSWRANPQKDNVVGYRLYYGPGSRYDGTGHLKSGFSYDYYLDFATSQRCRTTKSGPVCEQYADNEVHCEGLNSEKPTCTLYGLVGGYKYFTMTAYNAQAESAYTKELKSYFGLYGGESGKLPGRFGTLHAIYTLLLP
ncbi:MAG TPA: hypothetical protein ENK84_10330 [Desulfobulbus sp.]|nr:hypothetical protein [Desulfobulbus sp.]